MPAKEAKGSQWPQSDNDQGRRRGDYSPKLGYKQSLDRAWSGFSNFAISFTIISVLAGCFTTYAFAWNSGGPIAISWGWPIICGLILLVAFSMSELVSKYPTAGGIYYWASDLGGQDLGLVHRLVQPDRPGRRRRLGRLRVAPQFAYYLLSLYGLDLGFINFGDAQHVLRRDLRPVRCSS